MLRKLVLGLGALFFATSLAWARVDANTADQAALDGIKGLGPTTSKAILAERKRNGHYRDWSDFIQRVPGIGERNAVQLSQAGLTVNGKPK